MVKGDVRRKAASHTGEELGELMSPKAEEINGVPAEKHAWLMRVGELAREFVGENRYDIGGSSGAVCQAHAFTTEALLKKLGLESKVWVLTGSMGFPRHFFCVTDEEVVVDSYPEGVHDVNAGQKVNVLSLYSDSRLAAGYSVGFALVEEYVPGGGLACLRETWGPFLEKIEGIMEEKPPDLSELVKTNPFKGG